MNFLASMWRGEGLECLLVSRFNVSDTPSTPRGTYAASWRSFYGVSIYLNVFRQDFIEK